MKKNFHIKSFINSFAILFVIQACSSSSSAELTSSSFPYHLDKPETLFLPLSLLEISGITMKNGNPKMTYAVQDEKGTIYQLKGGKVINETPFRKNGDYEDISILDNEIYILESSGKIYHTGINDTESSATKEIDIKLPKGEYESLYADTETESLFILCKKCDTKKSILGFQYDLEKQNKKPKTFEIKTKAFSKKGFAASALARNPIDKNWYVISAIDEALLVFDSEWKFKEKVKLKKSTFRQPEGITFDRKGNLYISSEGDDLSKAKILIFKRTTD